MSLRYSHIGESVSKYSDDIPKDEAPTSIFEQVYMVSIMLYLLENDNCKKIELYKNVSDNPRMPDKLDKLKEKDIISYVQDGRSTRLCLTGLGRQLAEHFKEMDQLMRWHA